MTGGRSTEFQTKRGKTRGRCAMSDWFHRMKRSFYLQRSGVVAASFFLGFVCARAVFLLMPSVAADEHSSGPLVLELRLEGVVHPILPTSIHEDLPNPPNLH